MGSDPFTCLMVKRTHKVLVLFLVVSISKETVRRASHFVSFLTSCLSVFCSHCRGQNGLDFGT